MLNRKYLHHIWTRLRPIKTGYLLTAFVVCTVLCVVALRANYAGMVRVRDSVYAADKAGTGVEQALQDLRAYVAGHMNTDLYNGKGVYPPVQLKYTYERLVHAEQERVASANARIYTDAQKHCEIVDPSSILGRERVPCIEQYIKAQGTLKAKAIPEALYKFDFVSPRWSPDLAGWLLVLSVALGVLTLLRFVVGRWLQNVTR